MKSTSDIIVTNFCLPQLEATISQELDKVDQAQNRLPKSLAHEPQTKLVHECQEFIQHINRYAIGDKDHEIFIHSATKIFRLFRSDILNTIPAFDISTDNKGPSKVVRLSTPEPYFGFRTFKDHSTGGIDIVFFGKPI